MSHERRLDQLVDSTINMRPKFNGNENNEQYSDFEYNGDSDDQF